MSKLHDDDENPIDRVFINICKQLSPFFYKRGWTPNQLTSVSFIFGIVSVILLLKGYVFMGILSYMLSYFFDCIDGYYARRYNMISNFGDYYDHIKDIIVVILLLFVVIYKTKKQRTSIIISFIMLAIFTCLLNIHIGCQELLNNYSGVGNESSKWTKCLCSNPKQYIKYTKYFGSGTYTLIICALIWYLLYFPKHKNKKHQK